MPSRRGVRGAGRPGPRLAVGQPGTARRRRAPAGGSDRRATKAGRGGQAALDEEHFEPPPVDLPPQEDLHFWGAVIGLVAGPLMLLYVVFARPFHSTRWFIAAVVVSLLGFALLILRQPSHRDPTSGDDGARVWSGVAPTGPGRGPFSGTTHSLAGQPEPERLQLVVPRGKPAGERLLESSATVPADGSSTSAAWVPRLAAHPVPLGR